MANHRTATWHARFLLVATAVLLSRPERLEAGVFTVDLQFAPAQGVSGPYLTAPFDFGTRLSDIQSVKVLLAIPGGYDGVAATTGNSSWFHYLELRVHGQSAPPPVGQVGDFLEQTTLSVPPSSSAEVQFKTSPFDVGFPTVDPSWPKFLFGGSGAFSAIDSHSYAWHPLPDYEGAYSTTTWHLTEGIQGAQIVIEATPVPEAASASLALIGLIATMAIRRGGRPCR
jgi:hypothetical protein